MATLWRNEWMVATSQGRFRDFLSLACCLSSVHLESEVAIFADEDNSLRDMFLCRTRTSRMIAVIGKFGLAFSLFPRSIFR